MRGTYLALIVGLPVAGTATSCFFLARTRRFLATTPELTGPADLEAFKALAKLNMIAALAILPYVVAPIVLFFVGKSMGHLGEAEDFLYLLVPSIVNLVAGLQLRTWEKRMQAMPARDEALRAERDRVVDVWLHKPWANW